MNLAISAALVVFLTAAATGLHYEALRLVGIAIEEPRLHARATILLVLFGIIAAHFVEIVLFATGYWLGEQVFAIGSLKGPAHDAVGYLYFSAQVFTTVGFGDIAPVGDLRLLTTVQPIVGLLLIAWSASFTYLAMQELWKTHGGRRDG